MSAYRITHEICLRFVLLWLNWQSLQESCDSFTHIMDAAFPSANVVTITDMSKFD